MQHLMMVEQIAIFEEVLWLLKISLLKNIMVNKKNKAASQTQDQGILIQNIKPLGVRKKSSSAENKLNDTAQELH